MMTHCKLYSGRWLVASGKWHVACGSFASGKAVRQTGQRQKQMTFRVSRCYRNDTLTVLSFQASLCATPTPLLPSTSHIATATAAQLTLCCTFSFALLPHWKRRSSAAALGCLLSLDHSTHIRFDYKQQQKQQQHQE